LKPTIIAIIPARFASTRFPGKPLVEIQGKTMIQRVVEQVKQSQFIDNVIVATDDKRIFDHVKAFTKVMMTDDDLQSGTDRCAQVLANLNLPKGDTIIINVQGDEPFIQPSQIDLLLHFMLQNTDIQIGTLVKKITDEDKIFNPNIVKCVFSTQRKALYFSRNPIPYVRGKSQADWLKTTSFYKHIGMYAYRADTLASIATLPASTLELAESLEQLRWLENGFTIGVAETDIETVGIDTPEDLQLHLKLP
jgi:3-deoxy-manno-octulosonate cytidylyltransferase (CMP-KDO synthetase)